MARHVGRVSLEVYMASLVTLPYYGGPYGKIGTCHMRISLPSGTLGRLLSTDLSLGTLGPPRSKVVSWCALAIAYEQPYLDPSEPTSLRTQSQL